jgi:hypothetical protein
LKVIWSCAHVTVLEENYHKGGYTRQYKQHLHQGASFTISFQIEKPKEHQSQYHHDDQNNICREDIAGHYEPNQERREVQ